MKFGILGGTFDPVHFGHLRTAEEVVETFELEKVYLLPSKMPPHKKSKLITPFSERAYMIKLAIEESKMLDILDIEGKRNGYSYTIDTLKYIYSDPFFGKNPEIYFILGSDAFLEIHTWKDYRKLFYYANFVVVERPGYNYKNIIKVLRRLCIIKDNDFKNKNVLPLITGKFIYILSVTFMDISSTKIRKLIRQKRSISFLLPEKVKDYILKKGLYLIKGDESNR